jgi:hypothetical protein
MIKRNPIITRARGNDGSGNDIATRIAIRSLGTVAVRKLAKYLAYKVDDTCYTYNNST